MIATALGCFVLRTEDGTRLPDVAQAGETHFAYAEALAVQEAGGDALAGYRPVPIGACMVIDCDGCSTTLRDPAGGAIAHLQSFPEVDQALAAAGWTSHPQPPLATPAFDGHLCPSCQDREHQAEQPAPPGRAAAPPAGPELPEHTYVAPPE